MRKLIKKDVLAACKGGAVYASGGGAFYEHGLEMGYAALALDNVRLASLDELPEDGIILTQTAIGAPAGTTDWQMLGKDYIKAVQLVMDKYPGKVIGLMTPQNGKSSSTNGWLAAAALDLVLVDATGDIRAHPTGKMGAMGVANDISYQTVQAVAGGKPETGRYIEMVVEGTTAYTSKLLRVASDLSGGFIAAARNPLTVKYVKENGVVGGLSKAIDLGHAIIAAEEAGNDVIEAIVDQTDGKILARGTVVTKDMRYTDEAFDIGTFTVKTEDGRELTLHAQNEFMAIDDQDGTRLSTYPDVETVLDAQTAFPLSTNEIEVGQEVAIFVIEKEKIPLSTGVKDPSVYQEVEDNLGIELYRHSFG
ncbi:MAG: DUF917 domain-containing protein [Enterococcus sp.]